MPTTRSSAYVLFALVFVVHLFCLFVVVVVVVVVVVIILSPPSHVPLVARLFLVAFQRRRDHRRDFLLRVKRQFRFHLFTLHERVRGSRRRLCRR